MTNERGNPPPSFSPGAPRRPPGGADDDLIVVGTPAAPPVRRPSPPPAPRVTARPGGPAQPVWGPAPPVPSPARPASPVPRRSAPVTRSATTTTPPPVRPGARLSDPNPAPAARTHRVRLVVLTLVVLLVLALAWPVGLAVWANRQIQHTAALSSAAATPGTTYLLAGSDSRADGAIPADGTLGSRSDTILLLHVPTHGPVALISLPRDTYVHIDGYGPAKLNAAFAYGGAPLLVHTVEQLTGLKVDHYAEIGLGGVEQVVNAVGGVRLCYDRTVNDTDSGMVWTPGCHVVNGAQALAFSRMRKSDPLGDVGREARQRQLIGAVLGKVNVGSLVLNPGKQVALIRAGTGALTLDTGAGITDLARLALAFRAANGAGGITGTPPIKSINYQAGAVGSTVLLDTGKTTAFWEGIRDGTMPAGAVGGIPG
jgi:LCP family protein required for cell wall assembly